MQMDDRVTYVDICGVQYPLCLTISAQEQIRSEFGGISQMAKAVEAGEDASDVTIKLLHILMRGGVDRVRVLTEMCGNKTETHILPNADALRSLLTVGELSILQAAAFRALRISSAQTVEVGASGKSKNAAATQD